MLIALSGNVQTQIATLNVKLTLVGVEVKIPTVVVIVLVIFATPVRVAKMTKTITAKVQ